MTDLGIETVGQLAATPPARLAAAFGERDARWLEALARGVTEDAVEARKLPKSVRGRGGWVMVSDGVFKIWCARGWPCSCSLRTSLALSQSI